MRKLFIPFAALALPLAACGSEDTVPEEASGGLSADAITDAVSSMRSPRAGEYRSTIELVEFNIQGMPDGMHEQMRGMVAGELEQGNSFCLSQEEADRGAEGMMENIAEGDCSVTRFDVDGGTIDAEMQCTHEGGGSGVVTLNGTMGEDSSEMTMQMQQQIPELGQANMTMRVTSQRIGDCA